jgi:hypothetical protein
MACVRWPSHQMTRPRPAPLSGPATNTFSNEPTSCREDLLYAFVSLDRPATFFPTKPLFLKPFFSSSLASCWGAAACSPPRHPTHTPAPSGLVPRRGTHHMARLHLRRDAVPTIVDLPRRGIQGDLTAAARRRGSYWNGIAFLWNGKE